LCLSSYLRSKINKVYEKKEKKDLKGPAGERTEVSRLGEFALIDHLTEHITLHHSGTKQGVGDDAAVIDPGGKLLLLSTDMLVEGIHFDLAYVPLRHLGYKAAVANFSDIAAMNGVPKQLTVSMAVSNRFSVEALDELYSGIRLACERYQVDLVGGDTSSSVQGLFLSLTVTGVASPEEITYRRGARQGDMVCVTGDLGSAYIGLLILEREKKAFLAGSGAQPELQGYEYVLERQLKPEARTDLHKVFKGAGIVPTSMIDISDGLSSEILHLCKHSGLGCRLYEEKIPIDPRTRELSMEFKIIPSIAALSGGEDYELLFTVGEREYEAIKDIGGITAIGYMTAPSEGTFLITPDGKKVELTAQGWNSWKDGEVTK
jgi:thiamine-monophosphate kinase